MVLTFGAMFFGRSLGQHLCHRIRWQGPCSLWDVELDPHEPSGFFRRLPAFSMLQRRVQYARGEAAKAADVICTRSNSTLMIPDTPYLPVHLCVRVPERSEIPTPH